MASMQQRAAEAALKNKHVQAAAKREAERQATAKVGGFFRRGSTAAKAEEPEKKGGFFGRRSSTAAKAPPPEPEPEPEPPLPLNPDDETVDAGAEEEKEDKPKTRVGRMMKKARESVTAIKDAVMDAVDNTKPPPETMEEHEIRMLREHREILARAEAAERTADMTPRVPDDVCDAALKGDVAVVQAFLQYGNHPDTRAEEVENGKTLLCFAAKGNQLELMTMLLDAGATPDMPDLGKCPPLHHAAIMGHTEAAKLLLDRGADVDVQGTYGHTALTYAAMYNDLDTLNLLLDRGADHTLPDHYRDLPQHHAMINFNRKCEEVLEKKRCEHYRKAFRDETGKMYVPPVGNPAYFERKGTQGPKLYQTDVVYGEAQPVSGVGEAQPVSGVGAAPDDAGAGGAEGRIFAEIPDIPADHRPA